MIPLVVNTGAYSLSTLNAYLLHTFDVNTTTTLPVLGTTPSSTPTPIPEPGWHLSPTTQDTYTIKTNYDPSHKPNQEFKFAKGRDNKARKKLFNQTERHRKHVADAKNNSSPIASLSELHDKASFSILYTFISLTDDMK